MSLVSTTYQATLARRVVAPEHSLFREMNSDLLRDSHVCEEHKLCENVSSETSSDSIKVIDSYLLDEVVGLSPLVRAAVNRQSALIKLELQSKRVRLDATVLEPTRTELLGNVIQDLDVVGDASSIVLGDDGDVTQRFTVDDTVGIIVRQLGCGPGSNA